MSEIKTTDIDETPARFTNPSNPLRQLSLEEVMNDLAISRQEIEEGKYYDAIDALLQLGRENGYL